MDPVERGTAGPTSMAAEGGGPAPDAFAIARRTMVESQLRPSGINNRTVLVRMLAVPREQFVPADMGSIAYMDRAVPLGDGRFLAGPEFHGRMLQEAAPRPTDRALVVDGGSGYLPELLRTLVGSVEVITPEQALRGEANGEHSFSLLLIDGAVEDVPPALAALLAEDGRALTGLLDQGVTRLAAGRRSGDALALMPLAEIGAPVLPQFCRPRTWSF